MERRITDTASLGLLIKERRRELGVTQADLAASCNCSTVFLSALENGKETAEVGRALRILNTLGLNLFACERA